ncbi:MAG TPA: hypothetical protein VES42_22320 [Pilimelia sp.]|nr:hypothetical protein [Pilimelia sp.]
MSPEYAISRPPRARRLLTVAVAVVALVLGAAATPARAYAADARIDLKVLVVTDGRANVEAVTAQFSREGVPFEVVDTRRADRPTITAGYLADTVGGAPRAKYQAVVLPQEGALPAAELAALDAFEQRFKIRRLLAYTWAHPGVGLDYARWSGTVDGMTASVTAAAKSAGFGHLAGAVRLDDVDNTVAESFAALASPAPGVTYTPMVTVPVPGDAAPGSVLGVYAHDGREEMVLTISLNQYQNHARVLAHGIVEWLTRGVHLGQWRNFFSVHVDDVFLPDDRWHQQANCTVGDDCNPNRDPSVTPYNAPIRMTAADVDALVAWQRSAGIKLEMAFNGQGSVDAGAADPLTAALLARKADLRWLNHTYSHPHLGCVQDFTVSPWRCATDPTTGAVRYVSEAEIESQINQNVAFARQKGLTIDAQELVTGEHSGLRSLPQMPVDNPHLGPAMRDTGVRVVAADASRDPATRLVGPARTVPRHPMNIFYNVATRAEEVDEYNWIYTSQADGGSGICTANPSTSTCIRPLAGPEAFNDYIVPIEARIALSHVVASDPRPHYAHQSNIAEDRILYPVLDQVLTRYRELFAANTPLVNPRMAAVAEELRRADAWRAAVAAGRVEAYLTGRRVTIVNRSTAALHVPASAPAGTDVVTLSLLGIELVTGPYGAAYGTGRSAWTSVGAGARLLLRLPAA